MTDETMTIAPATPAEIAQRVLDFGIDHWPQGEKFMAEDETGEEREFTYLGCERVNENALGVEYGREGRHWRTILTYDTTTEEVEDR
jgi:hypothetical protein